MLLELLPYAGVAVLFFLVGAAVGAHNVPTVAKAITALKSAEANAVNTLQTIGQHKTGTTAPVTVTVTAAGAAPAAAPVVVPVAGAA